MLGLIIQDDMKWNEHVNNIVKKAGKRLYVLRILKRSNASVETLLADYIENNTWVRENTRFISSVERDISRVSAANE